MNDKALEDATLGIKYGPKDAENYLQRAKVYCGLMQFDKAIPDCSSAISINPQYKPAIDVRAHLY